MISIHEWGVTESKIEGYPRLYVRELTNALHISTALYFEFDFLRSTNRLSQQSYYETVAQQYPFSFSFKSNTDI